MKIIINDKHNLLSDEAVARAESKAQASFSKFGVNVKSLEITVEDINGPRGGVDKECQVVARMLKSNDITVITIGESLSKAIPSAINRVSRSVARQLERRSSRGARQSKLGLEA